MIREVVETDVLCAGGGIAGLMAAIKARELGASVIVAEKGVTTSSGKGRGGCDHYWCYNPEVHNMSLDDFMQECMLTQKGTSMAGQPPRLSRTWLERTFEIVKLWDSWGIPMKYNGSWRLAGHSFPGRVMTHLKYQGKNQKVVLTKKALEMGAAIRNRVMIFELLGGPDGVRGAIGVDTREDKLVEFHSKSVFLGTGRAYRIYPAARPALLHNDYGFTITGDGRAAAYRAGAELTNMEMLRRHAGIKNFCMSGQATWAGVLRDPQGQPIGKYVTEPDIRYCDIITEVDKGIFDRYASSGKGPVYMDCTGQSEDHYRLFMDDLTNEGNRATLAHLAEEGIDPRKHSIEFMTFGLVTLGRISINEKTETSVPGLFSGGDESMSDVSGASVFGWIGGESAANYAAQTGSKVSSGQTNDESATFNVVKSLIERLSQRENGTDWRDANIALQDTMADYAGLVRSQSCLEAGLAHLRRLKDKVHRTLRAKNRWELTRCLEIINMYDLAELIFVTALERKESRGLHKRTDFPYTDPLLNDQLLYVKKVDGKPVLEWRNLKGGK